MQHNPLPASIILEIQPGVNRVIDIFKLFNEDYVVAMKHEGAEYNYITIDEFNEEGYRIIMMDYIWKNGKKVDTVAQRILYSENPLHNHMCCKGWKILYHEWHTVPEECHSFELERIRNYYDPITSALIMFNSTRDN